MDNTRVFRMAFASVYNKSTASRLAMTLVRRGFLERQKRMLRLGPEVNRLGLLALGSADISGVGADAMKWLCSATGESVHIAVLEGSDALNIAQADGPAIVGIGNWVGRKTKLHCAANGKVLRAELQNIREVEWACNTGELEEGLNAVAVPVFDATGNCRAALSVSGPSYRVAPDRFAQLAELCKQAARLISFRLGYGKTPLKGNR